MRQVGLTRRGWLSWFASPPGTTADQKVACAQAMNSIFQSISDLWVEFLMKESVNPQLEGGGGGESEP
jgi:hypothetical protein